MEEEKQNQEMPQEGAQEAEAPTPEAMPEPPAAGESKKSYGPIVGIVIIVILLILAGFYFWGESLEEGDRYDDAMEEAMEENGEAMEEDGGAMMEEAMEEAPVSESDAIEDLEAELDSTIIDELDAELESIDAELNF